MNTIRMFAFAAALLITAALFAVIADGFIYEPAIDATADHTAAAPGGSKSAADRSSP